MIKKISQFIKILIEKKNIKMTLASCIIANHNLRVGGPTEHNIIHV